MFAGIINEAEGGEEREDTGKGETKVERKDREEENEKLNRKERGWNENRNLKECTFINEVRMKQRKSIKRK